MDSMRSFQFQSAFGVNIGGTAFVSLPRILLRAGAMESFSSPLGELRTMILTSYFAASVLTSWVNPPRHRLHSQGHRRRSLSGDWRDYLPARAGRVEDACGFARSRPDRRHHVSREHGEEDAGEVGWR